MKKNASVPPDTMWCLLLYSMRYAMGRRSSAPSDVADWIRAYRKHLLPEQVEQIAREVDYELDLYESQGALLGDRCDHDTWKQLVADLRRGTPDA